MKCIKLRRGIVSIIDQSDHYFLDSTLKMSMLDLQMNAFAQILY